MTVDKSTEYYLINSIGLNKKQIKDMLPSEINNYCNKVIKERIRNGNIFTPDKKS